MVNLNFFSSDVSGQIGWLDSWFDFDFDLVFQSSPISDLRAEKPGWLSGTSP